MVENMHVSIWEWLDKLVDAFMEYLGKWAFWVVDFYRGSLSFVSPSL